MIKLRKNIYQLGDKLWLVTSQAGFRKLWKQVGKEFEGYTQGYPTSYPSIVTYEVRYFGYHLAIFHCTPVNLYKKQLKAILTLIDDIDKTHSKK